LVTELLRIYPIDRIGGEDGDVDQIKGHRFFVDVDWEAYAEKQMDSPWVPELRNRWDTRYSDKEYADQNPALTVLEIDQAEENREDEFTDFDFISPIA
ncbi:Serine/threonine-protein kinase N1, partial [Nowakowskiella sp. JEL0407]